MSDVVKFLLVLCTVMVTCAILTLPFALLPWVWAAVAVLVLLLLAPVSAYYIVIKLARRNIIWTFVEQGWFRIVLCAGKFDRILKPGFHLIGIPGIHTLYSRKMSFLKAVVKKDGTVEAEVHVEGGINQFKLTRYPYALPFKDVEDKKGLHMSGLVTTKVRMKRPRRAFFGESDWYSSMNMEVMPELRDVLDELSYAETVGGDSDEKGAKEKIKKTVSKRLWKVMNTRGDEGLSPADAGKLSPAEKLSPVERLLQLCGLEMISIDLASIDPPPDWRNISLAPYEAEQKAKAAKFKAEESAILLDDTNQALEAWKKVHPLATIEQITEKQHELARRAYLKAGGQRLEIAGLENANTAVVGGAGGSGVLLGGEGGGKKEKGGGRKKASEMTPEELRKHIADL